MKVHPMISIVLFFCFVSCGGKNESEADRLQVSEKRETESLYVTAKY